MQLEKKFYQSTGIVAGMSGLGQFVERQFAEREGQFAEIFGKLSLQIRQIQRDISTNCPLEFA